MRDYAKVAPQFWTGTTGKALKKAGTEAVIVGMYLMTSPHANMIGVYHCPIGYIAIDTGLSMEGALKGLLSAIEAGFCTYEEESGYVFVHEFARYQIGDELDPKDKRVQGVINELAKVPKGQCWQGFRAHYAVPFHMPVPVVEAKPLASPLQAPTKPEAEAGEGTEAGTEADTPPGGARAARPTRQCPKNWEPSDELLVWAAVDHPSVNVTAETAMFRDHTFPVARANWDSTFRNWIRRAERMQGKSPIGKQAAIEQHNRAVGEAWQREQEALDASH